MMRFHNRPNVLPARNYTKGQRVEEMKATGLFRNDFRCGRKLIGDICDFCFAESYYKRSLIFLRTRGWKTCCEKCYKDRFSGKGNYSEHKIIMESPASKIMISCKKEI